MASRYWVPGGTGNWSSNTNWSATSGGASGAAAPTSADDVFVNALSGTSPTITVDATANCLSLDFTGAITPTLAGSGFILNIFGSLTLISTMTRTFSGGITFSATSTGKTITTAGKSLASSLIFNGVGGGWTLQDNLTTTGDITLFNGTLDTNSKTVSFNQFQTQTGTKTLTLGASIVNCSNNWANTVPTNFTLNAGTSTINMTASGYAFTGGGGFTYYIVNVAIFVTVVGSSTFNTLQIAAGATLSLTAGTTQTVTNIVSNGVKGNRATLQSLTPASAATISTAAAISASHLTVQDITKSGAGSITFRSSLNVSGNTGITFLDRYWVGGSGNWDATTTNWSAVSGGSSGASAPTSADDVFIDANSGTSPTITIPGTANCLSLDFTGAITPTLTGSNALNVYGSLTLISAMTFSFTGSLSHLATSIGKTITTAGKSLASIIFDGIGGGWSLQDDLNVNGGVTITRGALITNGKTVNCLTFDGSNSNIRSLTLGVSVINCASNWTFTTVTNLTFSVGTSTINLTGATKTFAGGGLTYNIVNLSGTPITITGSNTFATLTLTAGKTLKLTSGTTQTVTSLICNGTLASPSTLQSTIAGSPATIALPAARHLIRHTSVKDITVSGATSLTDIAGTNVSGNTGITFVTKFEMGRIKNDGSFNWYSAATGVVTKVSG